MSETVLKLAAIGVGGALGAIARYGVGTACSAVLGERFAYGTLLVNVIGCFVLGLLMHEAWLTAQKESAPWHAGIAVGLLGGLTTFSTFGYQTIRHVEAGESMLAIGNVMLNVTLGLVAAAAGVAVSRMLWSGS